MSRSGFAFAFVLLASTYPSLGSAQPTSCGTCAYLTQYCDASGPTCTSCSGACPAGSYESEACGGVDGYADRVCSTCMANCESCTNATVCDACASEHWFNPFPIGSQIGDPGECQACTTCGPNEVEVQACTPFIDRQCAASCPDGTVQSGNTCVDCGVTDCAACSAPGTCTACADGFFLDNGSCTACTTCAAGTHVSVACGADHDATCTSCSAGTYSNAPDSPTCTPCAANTFQANAGAQSCDPCAVGETSGTGQTACDCAAGSAGTSGTCSQCAAGTFAMTAGSSTCMDCPVGTYSAAGSMSCTACDAGSYSVGGAASCTPCAVGTYADTMGATSCSACATATATGATQCPAASVCGNGVLEGDEGCDDGNVDDGDGCDTSCATEADWHCAGEPSDCSSWNRSSGGCSIADDTTPALPWLALPIAFAAFVWRRRRLG